MGRGCSRKETATVGGRFLITNQRWRPKKEHAKTTQKRTKKYPCNNNSNEKPHREITKYSLCSLFFFVHCFVVVAFLRLSGSTIMQNTLRPSHLSVLSAVDLKHKELPRPLSRTLRSPRLRPLAAIPKDYCWRIRFIISSLLCNTQESAKERER